MILCNLKEEERHRDNKSLSRYNTLFNKDNRVFVLSGVNEKQKQQDDFLVTAENPIDSRIIESKMYERVLSLAMNVDKMIILGETFLFLVLLVKKCGNSDSCVSQYSVLAEECKVSISAVKVWASKLERLGFLKKEINGPNGLTFILNDEAIGRHNLFQKINQQLVQAAKQIQATSVVAQNSFKQALLSLLHFNTLEN